MEIAGNLTISQKKKKAVASWHNSFVWNVLRSPAKSLIPVGGDWAMQQLLSL
jgi:hypothetical protein